MDVDDCTVVGGVLGFTCHCQLCEKALQEINENFVTSTEPGRIEFIPHHGPLPVAPPISSEEFYRRALLYVKRLCTTKAPPEQVLSDIQGFIEAMTRD